MKSASCFSELPPPDPDRVEGGLWGLLVGDAVGVPYEFHSPEALPPKEKIGMVPPRGFPRSYSHVPLGTWSDDGAQALCLAASLIERGAWDAADFAGRLVRWATRGYMAVDGKVFDIGIQTGEAVERLAAGVPPGESGLGGERNNGNGSLMRSLPLALFGPRDAREIVRVAHEQSRVTHSHPRSQVCCALYALWAAAEMRGLGDPWRSAVSWLSEIYRGHPAHLWELERVVLPAQGREPGGGGYVVDALFSAKAACEQATYREIVQAAVAFGNDTDTTACIAGGIAGIRHGLAGIPGDWFGLLRGKAIVRGLLSQKNCGPPAALILAVGGENLA